MELHTNDAALILAFESICGEFECASSSIQTLVKKGVKPEPPKAAPVIQLKATPADKLYAALQQPQRFNPELQQRLKLSKSDFTKAVNELIKSGKIKRSSTKKTWVRTQVA